MSIYSKQFVEGFVRKFRYVHLIVLAFSVFFLLMSKTVFATNGGNNSLRIAVASNFYAPLKEICARLGDSSALEYRDGSTDKKTTNEGEIYCTLIQGSSGKLLSQILNGAPYDVFISADSTRPLILYQKGLSTKPRAYARGNLALVAKGDNNHSADVKIRRFKNIDNMVILEQNRSSRIAIANPKVAPYGIAAQEFLDRFLLENQLKFPVIIGQSAAQAFQFVRSGNAEYGVVPLSFFDQKIVDDKISYWKIPEKYHSPLVQSMTILRSSNNAALAERFFRSSCGAIWRDVLSRYQYNLPSECLEDTGNISSGSKY